VNQALGLLETLGLTPAMVAIDAMTKSAAVRVVQVELNDLYGVCAKVVGAVADVQTAIEQGRHVADEMQGHSVVTVIPQPDSSALAAIQSDNEFNPLIQQNVVMEGEFSSTAAPDSEATNKPNQSMSESNPSALGFIETQGFTAVFEAIDTACKAADVEVVGKEKLGGGYITVVLKGELSAVTAAIDAGREEAGKHGKLIAAHVVARPTPAVMKLLSSL
jgi:microcompartment protein CcmL/EutN